MGKFDWLKMPSFLRKEKLSEQDITKLEVYLDAALHPINPRPNFVANLGTRLQKAPATERNSSQVVQYALIGLAGVISGLIIFVTGIRATVTILGALGLLRHARGQVKENRATAA